MIRLKPIHGKKRDFGKAERGDRHRVASVIMLSFDLYLVYLT